MKYHLRAKVWNCYPFCRRIHNESETRYEFCISVETTNERYLELFSLINRSMLPVLSRVTCSSPGSLIKRQHKLFEAYMSIFLVDIPFPRFHISDYTPRMSSMQVLAPTYPFPLNESLQTRAEGQTNSS